MRLGIGLSDLKYLTLRRRASRFTGIAYISMEQRKLWAISEFTKQTQVNLLEAKNSTLSVSVGESHPKCIIILFAWSLWTVKCLNQKRKFKYKIIVSLTCLSIFQMQIHSLINSVFNGWFSGPVYVCISGIYTELRALMFMQKSAQHVCF